MRALIPAPDLDALAARGRAVLKDEAAATVELLGGNGERVVRKTYRTRGLRRLQTLLRRARAGREHDNLRAVEAAGVPCTPARGWAQRRQLGMVVESTLVTEFVADALPLKTVLAAAAPATAFPLRRQLACRLGAMLADLHRGGVLWCTPMPRNVLVQGSPPRLLLCDAPAAGVWPGPVPRRHCLLDLYDAAMSPSRRREWSAPERLRCLLAYAGGDRSHARRLWRRLQRRSRTGHRLRKNLLMALRTYILRRSATAVPGAPRR